MTVCIAAIYNNNSILGVSDRMLTSGDIQFEPPRTKVFPLTSSIVVMTAGDASVQTNLLTRVSKIVAERIFSNPEIWIPVGDIANLYRDLYLELKSELAEKTILTPYGLNYETFISRQSEMSSNFVANVSGQIQNFSIEGIETIVTGIDDTGPHIFVVGNGDIGWFDSIGFASVGIGSNHALSHFMLSGYTRNTPEPKALLTIHQAKKKSEISPGVGGETDMFVIGPQKGTFNMLVPIAGLNIVKDLDGFYKKYQKDINKLDRNIEEKLKDYLAHLGSTAQQKQEVNPTVSSLSEPKLREEKLGEVKKAKIPS